MFKKNIKIGYLFPRCNSIHTFFMKENIRETIHDPEAICDLLRKCGFEVISCADRLLEDANHGTTWFVIARKGAS